MSVQEYYFFDYSEVKFNKKALFPSGTLIVPRNSVTLIIGKNGTGKSTLLKQIRYRYNDCTYIAQHSEQILNELSVLENITMCQPGISCEHVTDILNKLNLTHLLEHGSQELSGGEKRIVSVLRALFSESPIILMDEPTNDLDYRTVDQIINILNTFKQNKTIIIVTHDERLYGLSQTQYLIENHSIQSIHPIADQLVKFDHLNNSDAFTKDTRVLKKFFRQDPGRVFCIALLCFLCITNMIKFSAILSKEIPLIKDTQVNFCNSLYDNSINLLYSGYLPTSFLDIINTDTSIWNIKNKLDVVLENTANLPYNLNLQLPKNEFVTYYDLFFYNPYSNELINVLDYCSGDDSCTTTASDYFRLSSILEDYNNIPFNDKIYSDAVNRVLEIYPQDDLELVFSVAIMDTSHIDFFEYISDDYFSENLKANYYVASNQTIALVQSAMQISELEFFGKLGLIFVGIAAILMLFNAFLVNLIKKKQYEVLRDYGFSFKDAKVFLRRVYNLRIPLVVLLFLFVVNVIVAVKVGKQGLIFSYLPSILLTILLPSLTQLEYCVSTFCNKKLFMFGGVFDDL